MTRLSRLSQAEAIENGVEFYYHPGKALHATDFFETYLRHSAGIFAGTPFTLLPWQREMLEDLFGWVRIADDMRRYKVAYISTAKKSGKSTLLAGIGLYLLVADGEPSAEIYSAAADRLQASIVFREAANMVRASPLLARLVEVIDSRKTLTVRSTSSFWRVLSGDAASCEGISCAGLMFDELHTQKDRRLWDALRGSGAARAQPLLASISTAGYDRNSICYEQYAYAKAVLNDWRYDPTFYPLIYETPEDADWKDPANWPLSNPSMGTTFSESNFASDFRESENVPSKENSFRRYRLNQWTTQDTRWIDMDAWGECALPPPGPLEGRECWVGLDLATTYDTSAMVAVFPAPDGTYDVLCRFWIPGDNAMERDRRDRVPYTLWAKDPANGLTFTPGDVTDYDVIKRDVDEFAKTYNIRQIGIDRWNATQLAGQLAGSGHDIVGFSQGIGSISAPSRVLENLIASGKIRHNGNKVLSWMIGNVAVREDASSNIKPIKPKPGSPERIDGVISLVMALGVYINKPADLNPDIFFL